jgi:hypothetical protein
MDFMCSAYRGTQNELCLENLRGRDDLGDLGIDERTILEWVSNKQQRMS